MVFIIVANYQALKTRENCHLAESDAFNIRASLADYYADPERTDVPSLETLDISLNALAYLLGSSKETITIITSSEPKRCLFGKYYVIKGWDNYVEWVDEWPADIPNPNPEVDKHNSFFSWIERVFN